MSRSVSIGVALLSVLLLGWWASWPEGEDVRGRSEPPTEAAAPRTASRPPPTPDVAPVAPAAPAAQAGAAERPSRMQPTGVVHRRSFGPPPPLALALDTDTPPPEAGGATPPAQRFGAVGGRATASGAGAQADADPAGGAGTAPPTASPPAAAPIRMLGGGPPLPGAGSAAPAESAGGDAEAGPEENAVADGGASPFPGPVPTMTDEELARGLARPSYSGVATSGSAETQQIDPIRYGWAKTLIPTLTPEERQQAEKRVSGN